MYVITFVCPMCGKKHSVKLTDAEFQNYLEKRVHGNELIQNVFPNMSVVDREKFITGYCDDCQKLLFGGFAE